MKAETLVVDLIELYQIIPECKALEGKNFKGVKELLKELITAIETSEEWEFVQYLQTNKQEEKKPVTLFIIRKVKKEE